MKRGLIAVIICLLLVVFGFSGYKLFSIMQENKIGQGTYESLAESYVNYNPEKPSAPQTTKAPAESSEAPEGEELTEEPEEVLAPPIEADLSGLLSVSGDTTGWIYCEGTGINYPIAHGTDNSYYLKHLLDGTYNNHGTVFVDAGNSQDFSDGNTIIYGHNMSDGTMFSEIVGYQDQAYYNEHPVMWLLTPEQDYMIELFSGYVTTNGNQDTYRIFKANDKKLPDYAEERVQKSDFRSGVRFEKGDRIVTLSTCEYSGNNTRYVLHGILRPCNNK